MPLSKCKRMNLSSSALKAPIATPEISFAEELPEEKESENVGLQSFKNADTPIPYEKSKRTFTPKPDVKKVATPRSVNPKHITLTPKPDAKKVTTPLSVNPKNLRTLTPVKSGMKRVATPSSVSQENVRSLKRRSLTKKTIQQPISVKTKKKKESYPSKIWYQNCGIPKLMSAKKMKGTPAPNYQQRKAKNSAQKIKEHLHYHVPEKSLSKKLPLKRKGTNKLFGGIPFIPSVKNTKDINFNFGTTADKKSDASKAISRTRNALPKKFTGEGTKKPRKTPLKATKTPVKAQENTPLKRRLGFDVRASLSKKLPYKPHKGPLRPLTEANLYVSPSVSSLSQKAPENKLVVTKGKLTSIIKK
ncbi:uncharacterized protein CEXT_631711 [Caerostris extrusa]|uniref:Uncharacterized protein n=1 Tax=Caerostris extrusa TaxID=172846 RepID=A0AAV4W6D3_CAEEX|nr:uncharacterized protein CEXT_631711 [Caerostris extrusa]